jgi:hypothetical protein
MIFVGGIVGVRWLDGLEEIADDLEGIFRRRCQDEMPGTNILA